MRRSRRPRQTPLWGALVAAAAMTPLPRRKDAPHTGAGFFHAGAREGIVAHAESVLHQMLVHAAVFGIALTCTGVLIYGLFWYFGRTVYRSGPAPRTANVRVRRGMSAWEIHKEMNRR